MRVISLRPLCPSAPRCLNATSKRAWPLPWKIRTLPPKRLHILLTLPTPQLADILTGDASPLFTTLCQRAQEGLPNTHWDFVLFKRLPLEAAKKLLDMGLPLSQWAPNAILEYELTHGSLTSHSKKRDIAQVHQYWVSQDFVLPDAPLLEDSVRLCADALRTMPNKPTKGQTVCLPDWRLVAGLHILGKLHLTSQNKIEALLRRAKATPADVAFFYPPKEISAHQTLHHLARKEHAPALEDILRLPKGDVFSLWSVFPQDGTPCT